MTDPIQPLILDQGIEGSNPSSPANSLSAGRIPTPSRPPGDDGPWLSWWLSNLRAWVVRRSLTRGLAELLAGDSPAWIRGYNAGFDEAWGQRGSEVDELRRLLFIAFARTTIPADDPLTAEIAAAIGDE